MMRRRTRSGNRACRSKTSSGQCSLHLATMVCRNSSSLLRKWLYRVSLETPAAAAVVSDPPRPPAKGPADVYAGAVKARVESSLSFRVPGKILERKVEMGTRVTAGTELAVLDPQDARLNLEAARAAVKAAQADL